MKHSILLLLLTAFFLRPSFAQELGEDVDDLRLAATVSATSVRLTWKAVEPADHETRVTYSVFRGTREDFTPSLSNRIASGLTRNSYVAAAPVASRDYYYYVKAVVVPTDSGRIVPADYGRSNTAAVTRCHSLIARLAEEMKNRTLKSGKPTETVQQEDAR